MGRVFLEHMGGMRLINCARCQTNLTNRNQLLSTRFTGATGKTEPVIEMACVIFSYYYNWIF